MNTKIYQILLPNVGTCICVTKTFIRTKAGDLHQWITTSEFGPFKRFWNNMRSQSSQTESHLLHKRSSQRGSSPNAIGF